MTAKEKAKELVNKFIPFVDTYHCGNLANSKQCALVAVDEILGQFKWRPKDSLSYWQEVKQEIEKL